MSSKDKQSSTLSLDRREFMVAAGATAVAFAPFAALAQAAPQVPATAPRADLLADWTIDDMWGVYPRPHEPIGYGRPREDGELLAAVDPVDPVYAAYLV
jgi:hypothetical protein